ncbi:urea amidolyase [Pseudooceanicola sediminis]|uniref:Urea amidolyase n=1 Tax=Pseudooceanicola sediminis TaxID=2211117 RepID=A0A399J5Q9_9RHOB|nr:urea amidolyase [Pseudooceanicola sediminis]KAA2314735.1 urea amidolyase [Puniceibacterium sp. HSS470]RII39312.1 urea amidolyase [Pseudooceanicola sediminis]|tara:strand:+ start:157952 stop:158989 length:1038 start_codon:yes stop_codon:yes gene_type:complete
MTASLRIVAAGPGLTVQDLGRPGHAAQGLSRGGALDPLALHEAAALLHSRPAAAIEMPGMGGSFSVDIPTRVALTGAPMKATLDGAPLRWHAAHPIAPGQILKIGGVERGVVGYLTPGAPIATSPVLGSRAAHLNIGIGAVLQSGDCLPLSDDPAPSRPACHLPGAGPFGARFNGGTVRLVPGPQSDMFDDAQRAALGQATFVRGPRSNRQAMQLISQDDPTWHRAAGDLASEPIQAGDVQITGDGTPFVLLAECQTIGGYPRIGSVHPADMGRIVQAGPAPALHLSFIGWEDAEALLASHLAALARLPASVMPLVRDPADIPDLLSYQLISGVTSGDDLDPTAR